MKPGTFYFVENSDYMYRDYKRIDNPKHIYEKERICYNQKDIHSLSCSLHGAMTAISNNMGFKFTDRQRQEIFELALDRGFDVNFGWYMNKAVKCVVDYCNDVLGKDYYYLRVFPKDYKKLLDRGFCIITGWKYRLGMGKDRQDGILDHSNGAYGKDTYGHLFMLAKYRLRKDQHSNAKSYKGVEKYGMVDNYFPKSAINETHILNMQELVKEGVLFPSGYIVVNNENLDDNKTTFAKLKQRVKDFRKYFNI